MCVAVAGAPVRRFDEQFMKKGTFRDSFNPNGGNGGAIANFGDITFNLRGVFRK